MTVAPVAMSSALTVQASAEIQVSSIIGLQQLGRQRVYVVIFALDAVEIRARGRPPS